MHRKPQSGHMRCKTRAAKDHASNAPWLRDEISERVPVSRHHPPYLEVVVVGDGRAHAGPLLRELLPRDLAIALHGVEAQQPLGQQLLLRLAAVDEAGGCELGS